MHCKDNFDLKEPHKDGYIINSELNQNDMAY